MESDLEMVIKNRATVISSADVKAYLRMALEAIEFCHARWVVHRDVKPNNFLIAASGRLPAFCIADSTYCCELWQVD